MPVARGTGDRSDRVLDAAQQRADVGGYDDHANVAWGDAVVFLQQRRVTVDHHCAAAELLDLHAQFREFRPRPQRDRGLFRREIDRFRDE